MSSLNWLGLEWDEGPDKGGDYGPYKQSEEAFYILKICQSSFRTEKAYRCFALLRGLQK